METIEDEINLNGNRKTMLGVRCFHELKFKLTEEAQGLGISLSEHCENILLNKDALLSEKEIALNEHERIKQELINAVVNLTEAKKEYEAELQIVKVENDRIKEENDQLKYNAELIKHQVALFTDKQLLFLFEKVKGQNDVIDCADGKKYITYSHPKDLLEAMIYSFNYKKP